MNDRFTKTDWLRLLKIIGLGLILVSLATTIRVYVIHNNSYLILKAIDKKPFTKIESKIDKSKVKEFFKNDPFELGYDPNTSWFTKTDSLSVFIEINPFKNQCELTSRVQGVWKYLDYLSKDSTPLSINIKTHKIDEKYCNQLYGYGKLL